MTAKELLLIHYCTPPHTVTEERQEGRSAGWEGPLTDTEPTHIKFVSLHRMYYIICPRSEADRWLGIAGSNPIEVMTVSCECYVLPGRDV